MTVQLITDAIARYRYTWRNEHELQAALVAALAEHDLVGEREVRLDSANRIDILVGRVGIEVKTKGAAANVLSQLQGYARSDRVDELILATTRSDHRDMPPTVVGKPLHVIYLTRIA